MSDPEHDYFGLDIEQSCIWRLLKRLAVWFIGA